MSTLPPDHPQRRTLADEVHARPPAAVVVPAVVSVVALTETAADAILARVVELARSRGVDVQPPPQAAHCVFELPGVRIKWERHGEFCTLTLVAPSACAALADVRDATFPSALAAVPAEWLQSLPGRVIAASDVLVLPFGAEDPRPDAVAQLFARDAMAGSAVLDEAAWIFTDFVLRPDGRSRWLVLDARMSRAQAARTVQRVIEIEIYRMVALLGFPPARAAFAELNLIEQRLRHLTDAIAGLQASAPTAATQREERRLLDELTRVAAELERLTAANAFRFSASQAYWDIVRARVSELREQRLGDLRMLSGFLSRRLAPAMDSCAAAARRQETLSARIERAGSLLRTRVDIAREEQNQQLLAAMDRRSKLQLRLQQTVEGLSVAAIAYYVVGLLSYLMKPVATAWPRVNADWITAALIPVVAYSVWRAVRRVRRRFEKDL
jgi:uncharacterized membrane-anchored protein